MKTVLSVLAIAFLHIGSAIVLIVIVSLLVGTIGFWGSVAVLSAYAIIKDLHKTWTEGQ